MPSVSEELEALRKRNLTKKLGEKLKDADGLSTPEQEQAKVQQTNKGLRQTTYKKDAVEKLNAGSKAVDQDLEFKRKQTALKKQDKEKQKEASKNLQSFNGAKVAASGAPSTKQANRASVSKVDEKKVEETAQPSAVEASETVATFEETPMVEDVPQLEEVDEIPQLEEQQIPPIMDSSSAPLQQMPQRIPNRAEKKAKKTMEKLGMTPVTGITRVTLKMRGNQGFFTIYQPDVFEKSGSYVIFGEAHQGTGMSMAQQQQQAERAAKMLERPSEAPSATIQEVDDAADDTVAPVDEKGLDSKDIELVMGQAGVSRAKAASALKDNNGDLVNAIMSLTT